MGKHRHDTDATRAELLLSARDAFASEGYAAARTEAIVERFGLTRGALYHHFGNKLGLFEAVVEDLQEELAIELNRRALRSGGSVLDLLQSGFQNYLELALRPDVRQVLLIDGPAVLGWERWQEIDHRYAFGATRAALGIAVEQGLIEEHPLDELTHVLLGAVTQAGLEVGRAKNPKKARKLYGQVIDLMINNLRQDHA